jgi:hypothetical protein
MGGRIIFIIIFTIINIMIDDVTSIINIIIVTEVLLYTKRVWI